jgi:hypothetical protein
MEIMVFKIFGKNQVGYAGKNRGIGGALLFQALQAFFIQGLEVFSLLIIPVFYLLIIMQLY